MNIYKKWRFPCGEVGIALTDIKSPLILRWTKDTDIFEWLQVIDAYKHHNPSWGGEVIIPYFPYSRQDKVFNYGESAAASLLVDMLIESGVETIITWDIHNESIFFDKPVSIENERALYVLQNIDFVCFPDKNAISHGFRYPPEYNPGNLDRAICFEKKRKSDGTIELEVQHLPEYFYRSKNVVINDDICDGGATFCEAARILKIMGFAYIELFVIHGFFTKGLECLYNAGIDKIITTNTVCNLESTKKLEIIKVI